MNKQIVIGLAGEIASGKGVVAQYLKEKHDARKYCMSDALKDILKRLHLGVVRKNLASLSLGLRELYGQDILIHALIQDIQKSGSKFVIVDGIRRVEELEELKKLDNFKLFYLETDLKIRYERLKKRDEKADDKIKTFEDFKKDSQLETEKTILELKKFADYNIDNSGGLSDTHEEIDEIIKNLS
ncbi:MAG: AAA family ATPase [Candidatus Moranbacteria bacterium]|nr:AAA family ATPase [Candidatus Moranbacteria bacterium]